MMYTTERSQKDWSDFLAFEKRMHDGFFLPTYKRLGIEVIQDVVGQGWAYYDVFVSRDGKRFSIDEKARAQWHDDFLVEIMQCVATGKTGWLYHRCDKIFYASWTGLDDTGDPKCAYLVDVPMLRQLISSNFNRFETIVSEKGYGITVNKKVSWDHIVNMGIGERIL